MESINEVRLVGHLARDPVLSYTKTQTAKCAFTVLTVAKWAGGESKEYNRCVFWGPGAEAFKAKNGDAVEVEGRLQTRSWEDKETGVRKYMTEVNVREASRVGGQESWKQQDNEGRPRKDDDGGHHDSEPDAGARVGQGYKDDEDDLPF